MDYLDYLADYDYDALPQAVRSTIDRATYEERREVALLMREPEEALPPSLQAAFLASAETISIVSGQGVKPAQRSKVRWLPWLAAAGWLLFLGVGSVLLFQEPETLLVEKTIFAPAAEPLEITITDTIYQKLTQVRYRTKYDTVYQEISMPPQLVYVRDTLYLSPAKPVLVKGSRSLMGKERVLDFLFSTD